MLLLKRLRARAKRRRQGALTVGFEVCKSVLDVGEGSVDLEHVSDVLRTLGPELIVVKTANKGATEVSAGADGREKGVRRPTTAS